MDSAPAPDPRSLISEGVRHPGGYAGWRGASYEAVDTGGEDVVLHEPGTFAAAARGRTRPAATVDAADLDWWIDVGVVGTWEGVDFSLVRLDPDGTAWGYLDDRGLAPHHTAAAHEQGAVLEQVDRGEVHLGVALRRIEGVGERVVDVLARRAERERERPARERALREARRAGAERAERARAEHERRRTEILAAISASLRTYLPAGWDEARVDVLLVGYDRRADLIVSRDGDARPVSPPEGLLPLLEGLKRADAAPGTGRTWLAAAVRVLPSGACVVDADPDREPDVAPSVSDRDYDLEQFLQRRSPLPSWWEARLPR